MQFNGESLLITNIHTTGLHWDICHLLLIELQLSNKLNHSIYLSENVYDNFHSFSRNTLTYSFEFTFVDYITVKTKLNWDTHFCRVLINHYAEKLFYEKNISTLKT